MLLNDKVILVTGGASGIRRATSMRLGGEGARVVAWLLSDQSGYVTGTAMPIDGGFTAK